MSTTPTALAHIARLGDITNSLIALFSERPTVTRAYYDEKAKWVKHCMENGMSATAARDQADRQATVFKFQLDTLEASILILCEERDHLRVCLQHVS